MSLPIKNGDFPWFFVCLPGRVPRSTDLPSRKPQMAIDGPTLARLWVDDLGTLWTQGFRYRDHRKFANFRFFWPKWEEIQTRKVVLDQETMTFTLQKTNIAMEKGPLIDDFHIKTSIYKGF